MRLLPILLSLSLLMTISCNRIENKAKETANKGGEVVGKTATEFFEGISEGYDKTLQCELSLSKELHDKGLQTGKYSIENDSACGKNNVLSLYLIYNKDFKSSLTVKAFDKNGLELGRVKMGIKGNAGDAGYVDFKFDRRTSIEPKSKITIE